LVPGSPVRPPGSGRRHRPPPPTPHPRGGLRGLPEGAPGERGAGVYLALPRSGPEWPQALL